jgi:hypothetical protein
VRVARFGVEEAEEEDERVVSGLRTMVARRVVRTAVVIVRMSLRFKAARVIAMLDLDMVSQPCSGCFFRVQCCTRLKLKKRGSRL